MTPGATTWAGPRPQLACAGPERREEGRAGHRPPDTAKKKSFLFYPRALLGGVAKMALITIVHRKRRGRIAVVQLATGARTSPDQRCSAVYAKPGYTG